MNDEYASLTLRISRDYNVARPTIYATQNGVVRAQHPWAWETKPVSLNEAIQLLKDAVGTPEKQ